MRLKNAEKSYEHALQEWLNNPKNENVSNEIIEQNIQKEFNKYLQELLLDENDCAIFISEGGKLNELNYLQTIFDHFKSLKIYQAIKTNCEIAFSHKLFEEDDESEQKRKTLIKYMQEALHI